MASRPELIEICKELKIEYKNKTIEELHEDVRKEIDKKFDIKIKVGNKGLSETLLKFMSEEYDYVFKDKNGNLVNYRGEKI